LYILQLPRQFAQGVAGLTQVIFACFCDYQPIMPEATAPNADFFCLNALDEDISCKWNRVQHGHPPLFTAKCFAPSHSERSGIDPIALPTTPVVHESFAVSDYHKPDIVRIFLLNLRFSRQSPRQNIRLSSLSSHYSHPKKWLSASSA
jgi:hypothetical protein